MGKHRVGLQKGLAEIFDGVSIPEEARGHGSPGGDAPNQTAHHTRLDRMALFEEMARRREAWTPIELPLKVREPLHDQIEAHEESKEDLEQSAVELVDASSLALHILGISKAKFWFLRKLGKIGPKPVKANGTLEWELSSVLRWIEWGCWRTLRRW